MTTDIDRAILAAGIVLVASVLISAALPNLPATVDQAYTATTFALAAAAALVPILN